MKNKVTIEIKLDEEIAKKAVAVSEYEKTTLNNYVLKLLRTNIEYHERVHGKINTKDIVIS